MSKKKKTEKSPLPQSTLERVLLILTLMEKSANLAVISQFLKSKEAHHSAGSWKDMRDKRIIPALQEDLITVDDLSRLLNEGEEFGRNHIFLFQTAKNHAATLMDHATLEAKCQKLGRDILNQVTVEEMPVEPILAQVREETANGRPAIVFKVVQKRREKKLLERRETGDRYTEEYQIQDVRAINTACLHESGLLEIRIQSHTSVAPARYQADLEMMWKLLAPFLTRSHFSEFSLVKAKRRLLQNRTALSKKLRVSNFELSNPNGTRMNTYTGPEDADLFADKSAVNGLDAFAKGDGTHCKSTAIWWKPVDGVLEDELHMLLSGQHNEFVLTSRCTRRDHEYALNELRSTSK